MLRKSTLASYGFAAFPLAALTLPIQIFLPTYYAQSLGLGLAGVGTILLFARLFDVITDPLIGYLSDRTHSKYGRRKPWVVAGLPILLLSAWFLLVPSEGIGMIYLLVWSLMLYLGWSMIILPLNAWGAELSDDYHERTIITGWREGFTVAGILTTLGVIAAFGASEQEGYALWLIALMLIVITPLSTAIITWRVPDRKTKKEKPMTLKAGLKVMGNNRPFIRLIFAYLINGFANALPATLFLLYVQYGLGMKDQAGPLLFIYFLCGVLAVPFWTWASGKFSKHKTWCFAMIWACIFFLLVPFVQEGDYVFFLIICITTGLSLGADLALPASMQADVVDLDTKKTGNRRTGIYFAIWSMVTKLSLALAAGVAFPLLDFSGFSAETGGDTSMLVGLYSIVPVILKIGAIAIMWGHPLERKRLNEVQQKI